MPRLETLTQIEEKVSFFNEMPEYSLELYAHKKMKTSPEAALPVLERALPAACSAVEDFSNDALYAALCALAEELELKNGQVLWPVRVAISGTAVTPGGATELAEILGKEQTLARMEKSIAKLKKSWRNK